MRFVKVNGQTRAMYSYAEKWAIGEKLARIYCLRTERTAGDRVLYLTHTGAKTPIGIFEMFFQHGFDLNAGNTKNFLTK